MLQDKLAKWGPCVVLSAVTLGAGAPAMAQGKSGFPGEFSANVALASEYYFRGLSQTQGCSALLI